MNSNNNQFLEQVDVLIVTAIKLEYDALLKVDTGAAPSSKWEHREGPTGFNVAFRSFRAADGGMLRVAATYALTMGGVAAAGAAAGVPLFLVQFTTVGRSSKGAGLRSIEFLCI